MKVGCLEKSLPMELQCIDKAKGIYNIYAPGQLDIEWISNLIKNPPEDANYFLVYSEQGRNLDSLMDYFSKFRNVGRWYKFNKGGFDHYVIDLNDKMPEEYR